MYIRHEPYGGSTLGMLLGLPVFTRVISRRASKLPVEASRRRAAVHLNDGWSRAGLNATMSGIISMHVERGRCQGSGRTWIRHKPHHNSYSSPVQQQHPRGAGGSHRRPWPVSPSSLHETARDGPRRHEYEYPRHQQAQITCAVRASPHHESPHCRCLYQTPRRLAHMAPARSHYRRPRARTTQA